LFAGAAFIGWCALIVLTGTSSATMPMQKQAKDAGVAVDGCTYCHVDKMPKKDAAAVNERGKWLVAEKAKRNATEIDGAWLKDYPGDKK
jgi:hypothetical protein